jgi:hypothetical protein
LNVLLCGLQQATWLTMLLCKEVLLLHLLTTCEMRRLEFSKIQKKIVSIWEGFLLFSTVSIRMILLSYIFNVLSSVLCFLNQGI